MRGRNMPADERCILGELWSLRFEVPGSIELSLAVRLLLHPLGCSDGTGRSADCRAAVQYGLGSRKHAAHPYLSSVWSTLSGYGDGAGWSVSGNTLLAERYGSVRRILCAWPVVDPTAYGLGCGSPLDSAQAANSLSKRSRQRWPPRSG